MWPEIDIARKENRHELVLSGNQINERLTKDGLDQSIFQLIHLNYLDLHGTSLKALPDDIQQLINLQTLVLHSNKFEEITGNITKLTKLKLLDLSRNCLKELPNGIADLIQLVTLNVSANQLENFPKLTKNNKLAVVDLTNNKLSTFPDLCCENLVNLAELKLSGNLIETIPGEISVLPQLKVLDLAANKIQIIPGELIDCAKLKELSLKQNPIKDKRLLKLIDQCRTKQILDYAKQNCPKVLSPIGNIANNNSTKKTQDDETSNELDEKICKYSIKISYADDQLFKVIISNNVKNVREYFVGCLVENISFDSDNFKKFIQLQNKLHDTVCGKRNLATIATHDFKKLPPGTLTYTTLPPNELMIKPLNRTNLMSGSELFIKLQTEANNLRKEKKRNTYSGIHKYLSLIEGRPLYPCLLNVNNEVISFPPITNSDVTKIDLQTTTMLIEVTSSTTQQVCKMALDSLLKDMVLLFEKDLQVKQVKAVDVEGNLKVVYPSKTDLNFDSTVDIRVVRE